MKKIIIFILSLAIVSCSKNKDDETFLEKYDGSVYHLANEVDPDTGEQPIEGDGDYYFFSDSDSFMRIVSIQYDGTRCVILEEESGNVMTRKKYGPPADQYDWRVGDETVSIITNNSSSLVVQFDTDDGYIYRIKCIVDSTENFLTVEFADNFDDELEVYVEEFIYEEAFIFTKVEASFEERCDYHST